MRPYPMVGRVSTRVENRQRRRKGDGEQKKRTKGKTTRNADTADDVVRQGVLRGGERRRVTEDVSNNEGQDSACRKQRARMRGFSLKKRDQSGRKKRDKRKGI